MPPPRIARLDIRWDLVEDERLRRLPDVIEAVGDRERVAGFPARRIVNFAVALVGHIRGGLGIVAVVSAVILSALSGSAAADPPVDRLGQR